MSILARNIHISWMLAAACFGFLIGVGLSLRVDPPSVLWLLIMGVVSLFCMYKKTIGYLCLLFCVMIGVGIWRGGIAVDSQHLLKQSIGKNSMVTGVIAEDPVQATDGGWRFRLEVNEINAQQATGSVWVSTSSTMSLRRSEQVVLRGVLSDGFGVLSASMYRAEIVRTVRMDYADVGRDVRDMFASSVRSNIQEPEASLGIGFLLGQKTALPEYFDEQLRLLGLTHIVVASGYNLTILVRLARRFFFRISRFTSVAAAVVLIAAFLQITGMSPSMVRASIVAGLSLAAWFYGRKVHPIVLIALSAGLSVALQPEYAWGDIGWLLSFTSFIGVIMFAPLVHAYFWGEAKANFIRQVFIETLSAQVLTLPIIVYVFASYSPLALLSNLLIVPAIPYAMLLVFIAGIVGFLPLSFLGLITWPAQKILEYMTYVVDKLSQWSIAESELSFGIGGLMLVYVVVGCATYFMYRRTGYRFRDYNIIE